VCRKGNLARRVAAQGCLLGEQPERLKPELAIRHREWVRVPGEGNRTPLSAWELYGAARLPPGDSATCGDIGDLTVSDRDYPQALLLSGTQRARRPLRPELAAPLGVWLSSQLGRCAGGRAGWRLSGDVAVLCCCTNAPRVSFVGAARCALPTRRPSLFRPDISPGGANRASVVRCRRSLVVAVRTSTAAEAVITVWRTVPLRRESVARTWLHVAKLHYSRVEFQFGPTSK
jgi:hypothetical protein